MKVVIFAGGLGTRLSEETDLRPKPMVEIGGKPILWHIMKIYSHYGLNDFIICLGYKGYMIKEYFMQYFLHNANIKIDIANNQMEVLSSKTEPWKITLIDTGAETKTAGRLQQVLPYTNGETFCLTYGDGVCDIDIKRLINFHHTHGKTATISAVQLAARFGGMDISTKNDEVINFREKAKDDSKWINAGFFVISPEISKFLQGDFTNIMWEDEPLEDLSHTGQLVAFKHFGFWKCMDALRDKIELEEYWKTNKAPWKLW